MYEIRDNKKCPNLNRYSSFTTKTDLLSYLLEAVQDRYAGDAVNLAERIQTDWIEMVLPGYPGILDDGTGRVMHNHHGLVVLEWEMWNEIWRYLEWEWGSLEQILHML